MQHFWSCRSLIEKSVYQSIWGYTSTSYVKVTDAGQWPEKVDRLRLRLFWKRVIPQTHWYTFFSKRKAMSNTLCFFWKWVYSECLVDRAHFRLYMKIRILCNYRLGGMDLQSCENLGPYTLSNFFTGQYVKRILKTFWYSPHSNVTPIGLYRMACKADTVSRFSFTCCDRYFSSQSSLKESFFR